MRWEATNAADRERSKSDSSSVRLRMTNPNSTVEASINKLVSHRESLRVHPEFKCEPKKTYCSEMTSCAEAYFHQERCGGTQMDGDGDGIPCEQQWCEKGD